MPLRCWRHILAFQRAGCFAFGGILSPFLVDEPHPKENKQKWDHQPNWFGWNITKRCEANSPPKKKQNSSPSMSLPYYSWWLLKLTHFLGGICVSLSDQRRMVVSVSNLRMWCFSHWSRTLWPAFTMVFMIISSANVWFFCVAWAKHRAGEDGQKIKGEEFNERMTYSEYHNWHVALRFTVILKFPRFQYIYIINMDVNRLQQLVPEWAFDSWCGRQRPNPTQTFLARPQGCCSCGWSHSSTEQKCQHRLP